MTELAPLHGRVRHSPWYRDPVLGVSSFRWYDAVGALHETQVNPQDSRDELFVAPELVLGMAETCLQANQPVRLSWGRLGFDEDRGRETAVIEHRDAVDVLAIFYERQALVVGNAGDNQTWQIGADCVTEIGPA